MGEDGDAGDGLSPERIASVTTAAELAELLRALRRRHARRTGLPVTTYRNLAARTGWSHSAIGQYFSGHTLPPPDRFDVLIRMLGAAPVEQGRLATALDRIEDRAEGRRKNDRPPVPEVERVPAQLPMDVPEFVGRGAELERLEALARSTPAIIALVGAAGVGKTSLAVHFAHRAKDRFPDGRLFVDLRGYHPERPLRPAEALAGFLRALGVAAHEIPVDEQEQASRFRTELAGRRALVILDNAAGAEQVRPLLPGDGACLVLVTSRDTQAGLVARHGAHRLELDLLPPADALELLRRLTGEQVERMPSAARELVNQCARLPLALRIAAEIAAARPGAGLTGLVTDLADERQRLRRLSAGTDRLTAVDAVFSWSYRQLPPAARRGFRLLGLHPGRDFDGGAVAALTGTPVDDARLMLDTLTRAHLVQLREAGGAARYQMHDLLHAYARSLVRAKGTRPDPDAARRRLYDHYLYAADRAVRILYPADTDRRLPAAPAMETLPPLHDAPSALSWLDTERANLVAVADDAARDCPGHTVLLARTLFRYLDGGHPREGLAVHATAVESARRLGDATAEAGALADLGAVYWQRSDWARAAEHFQRALDLLTRLGDPAGCARMVGLLGVVYWRQGRLELAAGHYEWAIAGLERIGDTHGQARAMTNLGAMRWRQDRLDEAADLLDRALDLHRRVGCRDGEAYTLTCLGQVLTSQSRLEEAVAHHDRAGELFRQVGDGTGETYALDNLGVAQRERGLAAEAAECHVLALHRFRRRGDLHGQTRALINLGLVAGRQGDHTGAIQHLRQALELVWRMGDRAGEAEALNALGEACHAAGQLTDAWTHHRDALKVAESAPDPREEARARAGLAALATAR